jgi:SAM-dependent methyltransferase
MFQGTAYYYAKYRLPYPQKLVDDLRVRTKITGKGQLLDLACGTGRVALSLFPYFNEVWAVDCEPEMIAVGSAIAKQQRIENFHWITSKAEELEISPESLELITIGEAFHRLNQPLIIKRSLEWLIPGYYIATMGCYGITRGIEAWQVILRQVIREWTSEKSVANSKTQQKLIQMRGANHEQKMFEAFGFRDIKTYEFSYPYTWTLDSIIGNLYSTSNYSKQLLGNKKEFEAHLKSALLAYNLEGYYPQIVSFYYTLAKKP